MDTEYTCNMTGNECKAILTFVTFILFALLVLDMYCLFALRQNQTLWIKMNTLARILFLKFESQGRKTVTGNFWKLRNLAETVRP